MQRPLMARLLMAMSCLAMFIAFSLSTPAGVSAAPLPTPRAAPSAPASSIAREIQDIGPFIRVSDTYTASLDAKAYTVLSRQEIAFAQFAIAKYNALPLSQKDPKQLAAAMAASRQVALKRAQSSGFVHPNANTCNLGNVRMSVSTKWWGNQWWVNDCWIYWANPANLILIGGVTVLVAIACGATVICGAIAVVLGVYLAVMYWALDHDTNSCGHRGAYINVPWSGPPWPSPVC